MSALNYVRRGATISPVPIVRTIAAPVTVEIDRIRGSRFIADAAPCGDEAAATAHLDAVRGRLRDATHHCFAWRLGLDRDAHRVSDDGEPAGTAGRPILRRIDGARLTNVAIVVTRYFGGTRLGTGGLVRAYGAAAAAAIARAEVVEVPLCRVVRVRVAYDLQGVLDGLLAAHGLTPTRSDYGAEIVLEIPVPVDDVDAVLADLTERCSGRARWSVPDDTGP